MAEKRKREEDTHAMKQDYRPGKKKQKRGFAVGPANLPDGPQKRKTQKIKDALIKRAQIKKEYAKLKRQGNISNEPEDLPHPASLASNHHEEQNQPERTTAPHPDRQMLIDKAEEHHESGNQDSRQAGPRKRPPKSQPFKREREAAQKRKAEADERRRAREEAAKQRQAKAEERERFRKAMAKARSGGPNGQRKLGRESKVLLEKVKRIVGNDG